VIEIEDFYGNKTTKRSKVPLMNHINEGIKILEHYSMDIFTKRAYKLHPIYQNNEDLSLNFRHLYDESPIVVMLVMEYRNIANASLSDIIERNYNVGGLGGGYYTYELRREIKTSPINSVNAMLIADKVQNYKDFKQYHEGTHPRSVELELYFKEWFKALRLTDLEVANLEEICYKVQRGEK
jgi:hypothetical protein